jgi:hypothetical protein
MEPVRNQDLGRLGNGGQFAGPAPRSEPPRLRIIDFFPSTAADAARRERATRRVADVMLALAFSHPAAVKAKLKVMMLNQSYAQDDMNTDEYAKRLNEIRLNLITESEKRRVAWETGFHVTVRAVNTNLAAIVNELRAID